MSQKHLTSPGNNGFKKMLIFKQNGDKFVTK